MPKDRGKDPTERSPFARPDRKRHVLCSFVESPAERGVVRRECELNYVIQPPLYYCGAGPDRRPLCNPGAALAKPWLGDPHDRHSTATGRPSSSAQSSCHTRVPGRV